MVVLEHLNVGVKYATVMDYKWARENFDLHCAQRELALIPGHVNRAGTYYKHLIREIERKYNVTL